jgi:hypothetical protein
MVRSIRAWAIVESTPIIYVEVEFRMRFWAIKRKETLWAPDLRPILLRGKVPVFPAELKRIPGELWRRQVIS